MDNPLSVSVDLVWFQSREVVPEKTERDRYVWAVCRAQSSSILLVLVLYMYLGGYALGMEWGGGYGDSGGGRQYLQCIFPVSPSSSSSRVLSWMWRVGYNCAWQAKESPQHKLAGLLSYSRCLSESVSQLVLLALTL